MGNLPDPDYEEGGNCDGCFGVGKPLGDFPTPKFVQVTFSNMLACPEEGSAPNGSYLLEQDTDYPCFYYYINSEPPYVTIEYDMRAYSGGDYISQLLMWNGSFSWFLASGSPCDVEFANSNTEGMCPLRETLAYGGTAEISWGPEI